MGYKRAWDRENYSICETLGRGRKSKQFLQSSPFRSKVGVQKGPVPTDMLYVLQEHMKYHKSSIKPPPPLFRGRKLLSPPSPFLLTTTLIINDRLYSCGLIRYGLFTCWKFGFVFDLWLHDLQLHVLALYHFAF